ncbi:MAG: hypothetical protein LBU11_05615 [Zoogloeaceae bacterium]|jgi:hypothetical protein|nr:hypothetical protein [Zoogloeaceae bacterium]
MNKYPGLFQSIALICVSSCLIYFHAQAAEKPIPQCPAKIKVKQEADSKIENGWKAANHIAGEYRLQDIGFSYLEFPAVQSGLLIPSEGKKLKGGTRTVFYDYLIAENEPHDYWAVCEYWGTSIVLVRKIPETIVRCEVNHPDDPFASITFRCFDTPRADAK